MSKLTKTPIWAEEDNRRRPLLPGQIRIELVYNPFSTRPYEVKISDSLYADSEDSFLTLGMAQGYISYFSDLKQDRKIAHRGEKYPLFVVHHPVFTYQYEDVGSRRTCSTGFFQGEYDKHRVYLQDRVAI